MHGQRLNRKEGKPWQLTLVLTESGRPAMGAAPEARWEEKGTTEDEMVGWHHQLDGHEFG